MRRNERKHQALEIFSRHRYMRPEEYAVEAKFFPTKAAWTYLLRLHRWNFLNRGRDAKGRIVYSLSRPGARRLMAVRRGEWPPVVRSQPSWSK